MNFISKRDQSEFVISITGDEHLIYDKVSHQSHLLTKTHYLVFCEAPNQDLESIALLGFPGEPLEKSLSIVESALVQLLENKLLLEVKSKGLSRRNFLTRTVSAAALPAIISLTLPEPAGADSLGSVVFSASDPAFPVPAGANAFMFENIGGGGGGGGIGGGMAGRGGFGAQGQTVSGGPIMLGGATTVAVVVGTGGVGGLGGSGTGAVGGPGAGGIPAGLPGLAGEPGVSGLGRASGGGGGSGGSSSVNGMGIALGGAGGGGGGGASAAGSAPPAVSGADGADGAVGGAGGADGADVGGTGGNGGAGNMDPRSPAAAPGRGGSRAQGLTGSGTDGQVTLTFCIV